MYGKFQFFMLEEDERAIFAAMAAEAGTLLVGAHNCDTRQAICPDHALLPENALMSMYLIWNEKSAPLAKRGPSRFLLTPFSDKRPTIQFVRTRRSGAHSYCAGTLIVSTEDVDVIHRFKKIRKLIQKLSENKIVSWWFETDPTTHDNPTAPDPRMWVGHHALEWLRSDDRNFLRKSQWGFGARGILRERGGKWQNISVPTKLIEPAERVGHRSSAAESCSETSTSQRI